MDYTKVFQRVKELDEQKIRTLHIDDGIVTYLDNAPTQTCVIPIADSQSYKCEKGHLLYVLPRDGDLLLSVEVNGTFRHAEFYQYDSMGSTKVVLDSLNNPDVMQPFPDGIPLLQCGKAFYLDVEGANNVVVSATYVFLDNVSRRELADYTHDDGHPYYVKGPETVYRHGVKLRHKSGCLYQVFNVCDHGYSPNFIGRV